MWQRWFLASVAVGSMLLMPAVGRAQGSGWTLWGGPKKELRYSADSGRIGDWDRYYLQVPRQRIAISEYHISYPENFRGEFDTRAVEVLRSRTQQKFRIGEVVWDRENRELRIAMAEPVPADTPVEIILSNVRNPRNIGMFFFNLRVLSPGDIPLPRPVGTWVIMVSSN